MLDHLKIKIWVPFFTCLGGALLFSLFAYLNHFPLIVQESSFYLNSARSWFVPADRSFLYSLFLQIFFASPSRVGLAVLCQAFLSAWILRSMVGLFPLRRPERASWIIYTLVFFGSSVPWLASQLSPDIFFAALVFSLYLFLFKIKTWPTTIFISAVFFFSCLVDFTFLPLALGLILLGALLRRRFFYLPFSLLAIAALVAALNIRTATNSSFNTVAFNLTSRLVDDGLVGDLLVDKCAERSYLLCPYVGQLMGIYPGIYLKDRNGPFYRIGDWHAEKEHWRMILDSVRFYPWKNFTAALFSVARTSTQFSPLRFLLGPDDTPLLNFWRHYLPTENSWMLESRQMNLNRSAQVFGRTHEFFGWLAIGSAGIFLLISILLNFWPAEFSLSHFFLAAYWLDAFFGGVFLSANAHNQSRALWPLLATGALGWSFLWKKRIYLESWRTFFIRLKQKFTFHLSPAAVSALLFAFSLTFSLAVAEAVVRHLGLALNYSELIGKASKPSGPDPLLEPWLWVMPANFHFVSETKEFSHQFETNSDGIFSAEFPVEKKKNELLILALGDSFTAGVGAEMQDSYPRQLERILNAHGKKIRVMNGGIPGSDPVYAMQLLRRRLLKYHPDIVLLTLNSSDVTDYINRGGLNRFTDAGLQKKRPLPAFTCFFDHSHLVRLIAMRVFHYDWFLLRPDQYEREEKIAIASLADTVAAYEEVARREHFKFFPFVQPMPKEFAYPARSSKAILNVAAELSARKIFYANLILPYWRRVEKDFDQSYYWPNDAHFTAKGYQVLAETVAEALREHDFLSSGP